ncbi:MAG: HEAT repeat domain-containing protein [Acidiferrobacterales bacterium]
MKTSKNVGDVPKKILRTLHGVLERDNSLSRCCAVKALEKINARDKKSKETLIGLLLDPDPDVRTDAATALGRMHVVEATEPLIGNLENDPEGEVRIAAVRALSEIRSKKAVEPLICCFRADGYPELDQLVDDMEYGTCWEVQAQALHALGEIGDQRATVPVMEALENEDYEDLQENGFHVLARLNTGKAQEFLLTQLKAGTRLGRRRAAEALAALPELRRERPELSPELLTGLTDALMDPDSSVRVYAARALGGSRNPLVVVPLTLLLTDPDPEVRKEVATLLGQMRGREVVERLHSLLTEPDPKVKQQIARVLGDIGDPASLAPLSQLLDTKDDDLLYEVVQALGKTGVPGPREKLAEILANKTAHAAVRMQAAWALGRILGHAAGANNQTKQVGHKGASKTQRRGLKKSTAQQVLADSVFDADERVAFAALTALAEMDPKNIAARLARLLQQNTPSGKTGAPRADLSEDADARKREPGKIPEELKDMLTGRDARTSTLASIFSGPVQAEEATLETIEAPPARAHGNTVRILAARLLGGISSPQPQVIDALVDAARAGENSLRSEALQALGRIGDKKGLPAVIEGLGAEQREVRLAAVEALAGLTRVAGTDKRLAALYQDPDPAVRLQVVQALGFRKGPKVGRHLYRALEDENLEVCRAALGALSKQTYTRDCTDRIVDLMFRFSGELRQEAAAALRRLRDFSPAAQLLNTLNNQDQEEFHWICIDALAEMYAGGRTQT